MIPRVPSKPVKKHTTAYKITEAIHTTNKNKCKYIDLLAISSLKIEIEAWLFLLFCPWLASQAGFDFRFGFSTSNCAGCIPGNP